MLDCPDLYRVVKVLHSDFYILCCKRQLLFYLCEIPYLMYTWPLKQILILILINVALHNNRETQLAVKILIGQLENECFFGLFVFERTFSFSNAFCGLFTKWISEINP